ncbi:MAG TPA: IS481 family transposase [Candidatus Limnocylindrales bacterium]|nr:IS481 family transposase [Candidatus Limnocylindrales bacterium]
MGLHRNARLGLAGRRALVADVEAGCSCREAARRRGVSPSTACKWWRRWSEATLEERRSLACLADRSSRPHRSPRLLPAAEQHLICAARRRTGWGPRLIAGVTGHPHATVWRALRREGISRPPKQPREQSRRYEWPCPGDLLHIDSKRFVRFTRPGHARTGDRYRSGAEKRMRVGYEWVHSLVDDHSRLAYSELHRDERAATVTGFVKRGLAFHAAHGIEPKRLLSDNAFVYRHNRSLRELLARRGIRHLLIPPRRPQVNGKVERYQQTLKREWALGQTYRSSDHRARALSHWRRYYNERRPHSSLGGRPPISRVHNVPRQDT